MSRVDKLKLFSGQIMNFKMGLILVLAASVSTAAGPDDFPIGYSDTPYLPDGEWRVHDIARPRAPVVTPGTSSSNETPGEPPSDAIVLFDGSNLDAWYSDKDGGAATWHLRDGYMEVVAGSGNLVTRDTFGDAQLHVEFATPAPPINSSQGRGNSGVFLLGRYEVQILDSYENVSFADGEASAIFGQAPPLVNASRPPGVWQSLDVVYTTPRFADGKLESPAFVTVLHNGIVTQDHTRILGPTVFGSLPPVDNNDSEGPILLQNHDFPVRFRNIWIRSLSGKSSQDK